MIAQKRVSGGAIPGLNGGKGGGKGKPPATQSSDDVSGGEYTFDPSSPPPQVNEDELAEAARVRPFSSSDMTEWMSDRVSGLSVI